MFTFPVICLYADHADTNILGVSQVWLKIVDYEVHMPWFCVIITLLNLDSHIFVCQLHDKMRKGSFRNCSCDLLYD